MVELWDAYDINFEKIDDTTLVRGEKIPQGMFHLVCEIVVKHVDGTYLLMQRDLRKHLGGMWELTAGGSALQGETPVAGAVRELKEETGIKADRLFQFGKVVSEKTQSIYFEFMCVTDCSKDSVVLQEGETIAYKWVTRQELTEIDEDHLASVRSLRLYNELLDYSGAKLRQNIFDVILEGQLKIGYQREAIRLYYPLSSLGNYLNIDTEMGKMAVVLDDFCDSFSKEIGPIAFSYNNSRFCLQASPEVSEYVHDHCGRNAFLEAFISKIGSHGITIEEIKALFEEYSEKVVYERIENGEFDFLLYFRDGSPDGYRYCFKNEGEHLTYHRFSEEDYKDLI